MYKKIFFITSFLAFIFLFLFCKKTEKKEKLTDAKQIFEIIGGNELNFNNKEEKKTIQLKTNIKNWSFRVDMAEGSSSQHEQNKAVFLGNLDFKTAEDDIR